MPLLKDFQNAPHAKDFKGLAILFHRLRLRRRKLKAVQGKR